MRTWLTGVGAMTLVGAVSFALVFELWSDGILRLAPGRPEFEIVGLPAFAVGAAVGVATGGWRGLLALVALASLWVLMIPFIASGADRDFYLRQLWAYEGIALGVLIAAVRPLRASSAVLVGAGVYGIAMAPNGILEMLILRACPSNDAGACVAVSDVVGVLCGMLGAVAAGLIVGRSASLRGIALLAVALALPSAVMLAHQDWMWQYDGLPSLLGMGRGVVAAFALLAAAWVVRSHARGPAPTNRPMQLKAGRLT